MLLCLHPCPLAHACLPARLPHAAACCATFACSASSCLSLHPLPRTLRTASHTRTTHAHAPHCRCHAAAAARTTVAPDAAHHCACLATPTAHLPPPHCLSHAHAATRGYCCRGTPLPRMPRGGTIHSHLNSSWTHTHLSRAATTAQRCWRAALVGAGRLYCAARAASRRTYRHACAFACAWPRIFKRHLMPAHLSLLHLAFTSRLKASPACAGIPLRALRTAAAGADANVNAA